MSVGIGYVKFWSVDISVTVGLGDGPPDLTQGFGGWEEKEIPRRKARTTWKGRQPWRLDIPLRFDDMQHGRGTLVERDIRNFEKLAGSGISGEPPVIRMDSSGLIPHDYRDNPKTKWVLDGIDWGDAIRNQYGNRIMQECTASVLEYVEDEYLKAAAKRRAKSKSKGPTRYKVKKGDTLKKVAKAMYGDASKWKPIGTANKIRDPNVKLKTGRALRIPR